MRCGAAHRLKCLEPSGGIVLESRIRKAEDFFFANFNLLKMLKFGGKVLKLSKLMGALILAGFLQVALETMKPSLSGDVETGIRSRLTTS